MDKPKREVNLRFKVFELVEGHLKEPIEWDYGRPEKVFARRGYDTQEEAMGAVAYSRCSGELVILAVVD